MRLSEDRTGKLSPHALCGCAYAQHAGKDRWRDWSTVGRVLAIPIVPVVNPDEEVLTHFLRDDDFHRLPLLADLSLGNGRLSQFLSHHGLLNFPSNEGSLSVDFECVHYSRQREIMGNHEVDSDELIQGPPGPNCLEDLI